MNKKMIAIELGIMTLLAACDQQVVNKNDYATLVAGVSRTPILAPLPSGTPTVDFAATGQAFGRKVPTGTPDSMPAVASATAPATAVNIAPATRAATAPAVANVEAHMWDTADSFVKAVGRPCNGAANCRDLAVGDVTVEKNGEGQIVGFAITPRSDGTYFRIVNNTGSWQFGFMASQQDRQTRGLTLDQVRKAGLKDSDVGSGIPKGFDGLAEGANFYLDQSEHLGKLDGNSQRLSVAPSVKPTSAEVTVARSVRRENLKTAQQVFDAIYRPCDPNLPNVIDLRLDEITPEYNQAGKMVGFRISRERNQKTPGNIFYGFCVNIPPQWGMQYGYLHFSEQRKAMGLTPDEARLAGFNQTAVGAGVPADMDLVVDGVTIFFDLSTDYAKLPLQTGWDRSNRR